MPSHDVIVVGAGPAGLFASLKLSEAGKKVLIVDEGKAVADRHCPMLETGHCINCSPCDIMSGLGGAGLYSDGTLNLRPDVGGDLAELTGGDERAWGLVEDVDRVFLDNGAPQDMYGGDEERAHELERKCASEGVKFVRISQRHIGTENTPAVIDSIANILRERGVEFMLGTRVEDIIVEDGMCVGVSTSGGELRASTVLLAPGRVGAKWVDELVGKHEIKATFGPIDVGVRVEVPSLIMQKVVEVNHDPKFHIRTPTYDDFVRTFCTNYNGWVVKENYDGLIGVNGHSMHRGGSGNTNFAFLVRVRLTEPVEDTIEYGRAIADLATTIGGGKPIIQRLGDLKKGRRSHLQFIEENPFPNTLKEVTPGDISMAMPHRIVTDIIEGLEMLNNVIPGVHSDSTLLYAPEIKFYSMCVIADSNLQSSIPGLYVAGDGVGLSRDIVNAAATGLLASEGIVRR
jgi:uncharacterized FAD-dependent dehydrogenase